MSLWRPACGRLSLPGNPTRSYRTWEPVEIVGELVDWIGHSPDQLQAMRDGLADMKCRSLAVIYA